MKNVLAPFGICMLLLFACNESNEKKISASEVPPAVVTAFNTKYPNASDVEWEQEKENGKMVYEAEFKSDGKKIEAEFDADGTFMKEE